MKRLLLLSVMAISSYSCCKMACEDQGVHVRTPVLQAADIDTIFLIKYKSGTQFNERIDTIKRYSLMPAGGPMQPASFFEVLDFNNDWKVVIPALNKEYFISDYETVTNRCQCGGDKYRTVKTFRFNNTSMEGNTLLLN